MAKRFIWTAEEARVIEQQLGEGAIKTRADLKNLLPEPPIMDLAAQIRHIQEMMDRLERRVRLLEEHA